MTAAANDDTRLGAILLVFGLVAVRLPYLLHGYAINDEAVYGVVSTEWLKGGRLYIDALERRPPLLFAAYAAVFAVAGPYNVRALHVAATAWVLLSMLGLFVAAKRLFHARAGLVAAGLYGLYSAWGEFTNLAWNGEILLNLPLVWSIAVAVRPPRSRVRPELLLAGALVACAFLFKQPAAAAAVAIGVYLLLPEYRRARGLSVAQAVGQAGLFTLGFAAVVGGVAACLRARGNLREALYWVFTHHDMPHPPTDVIFWERLAVGVGWFVVCCYPLLAAAAASLGRRSWQAWWPTGPAERKLTILLVITGALGVCASGRFYLHYFLLLLPGLTLAAAPVVAALLSGEAGNAGDPWPLRPRALRWALVGTIAAFLIAHVVGLAGQNHGHAAARFVREHSVATDRIFVWGETPRVYFEAQRRGSSRFVCTYALTGFPYGGSISYDPAYPDTTSRVVPGAWATLEAELAIRPPRYIVDVEAMQLRPRYPLARFPTLARLIETRYRKVTEMCDGIVYERTQDRN